MLRSRKRASSNPAPRAPPSASASLAATKAFIRDRESNGALSSAAAAAALRTHSTTPTPVGDTVTKRMVRKASLSSQGSGSLQRPDLRRHSSSGSMTERSFRAPSPARSAPSPANNSPIDPHAPPVPAVPKNVPATSVVQRRNSSMEPPARGGSPAGRGGGRGVSLDRGTSNAVQSGRGPSRTTNLSSVVEDEDPGHRSSINFSRPMSPPQASFPAPKPVASARGGQSGWFGGPVVNSEQTFRGTAPRPKTADPAARNSYQGPGWPAANKHASNGAQGTRLAAGSMHARPSGTAVQAQPASSRPRIVDPNSPFAVYDPSSRQFIHKQDAMDLHRAMSDAQDPAPPYEPQRMSPQPQRVAPPAQRAAPQTQRAPSQQPQPAPRTSPLVQRSASLSPGRDAPRRVGFADQDKATAPVQQRYIHEPTPARDTNSTSFTAQQFAEAEQRLPRDSHADHSEESLMQKTPQAALESPKQALNQSSPYPYLTPSSAPSLPAPEGTARPQRTPSVSPARNAHFAAVALELPDGIKHQPPGRSASPAKPALKASPSVSRRSNSPLVEDSRSVIPDMPESMSDDATKKTKKKVRISFDDEPTIVGTSAYADSVSPNGAVGANAHRWDSVDDEDDEDDYMKPRPVLPSFGSIRGDNRRERDDDVPEKVTETVSSSLSNSTTLAADSIDLSSDHKIGGILSQDLASKKAASSPNDPLPPEVTSVEGSGYYSDSDHSSNASIPASAPLASRETEQKPAQTTFQHEPKTLTNPTDMRPAAPEVPTIAVQPASPPIPDASVIGSLSKELGSEPPRPSVPGGWDDDYAEPEIKAVEPVVAAPVSHQPSVNFELPVRPTEDDSSDDNSSVYSDAYEDMEEGEGFASIDAIMESPVTTSRAPTESPVASKEPRQHATGLAASKWAPRNSKPVNTDTSHDLLINKLAAEPNSTLVAAAPAKRERKVQVAPAVEAPIHAPPPSAKAAAQPRKSALKKTTSPPAAPRAEIPLRKTMRDRAPDRGASAPPAGPHMRKSMRAADPGFAGRGSPGPSGSRMSLPPLDTKMSKGALQKKNLPAASAAAASRPRPQSTSGVPRNQPLAPAPTYDSDSDASVSSFQRERRNRRARNNNNSGGYTMRTSMRSGGAAPTMRAAPPAVRSISPPAATSPPPSTLRKSMRPSSPTPESPKSSRFSIRSLSPAGRFRRRSFADAAPPVEVVPPMPTQKPAKPAAKKSLFGKPAESKPPSKVLQTKFKSRIDDSSDEDEPRQRFQSRFADSDSEEEDFELPPDLTPVRGIPRRAGEEDGDSTDLEDETSDTERQPAPVTNGNGKAKTTNGATNGQRPASTSGSLRKPKTELSDSGGKKSKSKRGFFGLGRKKDTPDTETASPSATDIPMPPEQQHRDTNRPLTPIGEDQDMDASEISQHPFKLQGRSPPTEHTASESWPLPDPPKFSEDQRPQSADGPLHKRNRPALLKRHSSQVSRAHTETDVRSGKEISFGRTGKKKKFQGLRRVFGLHD